jgi:hypothetical protein
MNNSELMYLAIAGIVGYAAYSALAKPLPVMPEGNAGAGSGSGTSTSNHETDKYVFVDSWNGEGIFQSTKSNSSLIDGNGVNRIANLPNNCLVGRFTGRSINNMLEVEMTINNLKYKVFIAPDEVVQITGRSKAAEYVTSGKGIVLPESVKSKIISFFQK